MINQLGLTLVFLCPIFLIVGLIHYLMLRQLKNKYKTETLATISSCREYALKKGKYTYIYQALILDFEIDKKIHKVRQDIGRRNMPYSKTNNKRYSLGEQVRIYYNSKNPSEIDVEINNSRKVSVIMWRVFLYAGLVGLLVGIYLTFYYN